MSNVPSIPTAPSQGLPTPLGTENEGLAAPVPPLGSIEIAGSSTKAPRLVAKSGVTLTDEGGAIGIAASPGAGTVPVGDLIPGAPNTVVVTDPAGTPAEWALIKNANVDPAAAIDPSKIAIAPTVTPAALSVDWSKGSVFSKTLAAGANAITFANTTDGQTITLRLTSDGGGSTVSWPVGTKWSGGTPPTQTSTGVDVYTFIDIGGTIYGQPVQNFS